MAEGGKCLFQRFQEPGIVFIRIKSRINGDLQTGTVFYQLPEGICQGDNITFVVNEDVRYVKQAELFREVSLICSEFIAGKDQDSQINQFEGCHRFPDSQFPKVAAVIYACSVDENNRSDTVQFNAFFYRVSGCSGNF